MSKESTAEYGGRSELMEVNVRTLIRSLALWLGCWGAEEEHSVAEEPSGKESKD